MITHPLTKHHCLQDTTSAEFGPCFVAAYSPLPPKPELKRDVPLNAVSTGKNPVTPHTPRILRDRGKATRIIGEHRVNGSE